jgi:hypothetical protein
MSERNPYAGGNQGKHSFATVYNRAEPGAYFETLGKLDYVIPGEAKPVFQKVIEGLRGSREIETVTVLDLGCSYGVNAALLKYDLEMDQLYEWYGQREADSVSEARALDERFFAKRMQSDDLEIIGIDVAEKAVDYAVDIGLLDAGIAANLEEVAVPEDARRHVRGVDLVTSTGCIGYVTERTFRNLLPVVSGPRPPWVASFVLRMFPYDGLAGTLAAHGLATEKLAGQTFPQRRFASREEQAHVCRRLEAMGLDAGLERREGRYFAELFLSRPEEEARRLPLARLLAGLDGNGH